MRGSHRLVPVRVTRRFALGITGLVLVMMMVVLAVRVRADNRIMSIRMRMTLGEVKPGTEFDEASSDEEPR